MTAGDCVYFEAATPSSLEVFGFRTRNNRDNRLSLSSISGDSGSLTRITKVEQVSKWVGILPSGKFVGSTRECSMMRVHLLQFGDFGS
jgi:hypothetical protein